MSYNTPLFPSNRPPSNTDRVFQWHPIIDGDRIMPSGSKQSTGWLEDERPAYQYHNAMFGALADWLTMFDTMIPDFDWDSRRVVTIGHESMQGAAVVTDIVAIGQGAGVNSSSSESVFLGSGAGNAAVGDKCVAIGYLAGRVTLHRTVSIGFQSGINSTSVALISIGYNAGNGNLLSDDAVCIGTNAGDAMDTGADAIAVGRSSGKASNSVLRAIMIGFEAGNNMGDVATPSTENIAIGYRAGKGSDGLHAILIGTEAGENNTDAEDNVIIGYQAGKDGTGRKNVIIGSLAGIDLDGLAGEGNMVIIGYKAGPPATEVPYQSVMIGSEVMNGATGDFDQQIAIGYQAGKDSVQTGALTQSILIGVQAGEGSVPSNNVVIGWLSGKTSTGVSSVMLGNSAGQSSKASSSVMLGNSAGQLAGSVVALVGLVAIGLNAGLSIEGDNIVAIGRDAGNGAVLSEGAVFIGFGAGKGALKAANSTFVGDGAGNINDSDNGVGIGFGAGNSDKGANNVHVGYQSGFNSNSIGVSALGYKAGKHTFGASGEQIGDGMVAIGHMAGAFELTLAYKVPAGTIFLGNNTGTQYAPAGEMATNWDDFKDSHSVLQVGKDGKFLFGFSQEGAPTLSVVGTNALLKIGVSSAAQRTAFDTLYSDTSKYPEAIGAMTLDDAETDVYIYTSTGFKKWAIAV